MESAPAGWCTLVECIVLKEFITSSLLAPLLPIMAHGRVAHGGDTADAGLRIARLHRPAPDHSTTRHAWTRAARMISDGAGKGAASDGELAVGLVAGGVFLAGKQ